MIGTYHLLIAALGQKDSDADRPRPEAYDHTFTHDLHNAMRLDTAPCKPPVFAEPDLGGFDFGPVGPPNRAQRRAAQKAQRRARSKS